MPLRRIIIYDVIYVRSYDPGIVFLHASMISHSNFEGKTIDVTIPAGIVPIYDVPVLIYQMRYRYY